MRTQERKEQRKEDLAVLRSNATQSYLKRIKGKKCSCCWSTLDHLNAKPRRLNKCYNCFREMHNRLATQAKERKRSDPKTYISHKASMFAATAKQRGHERSISKAYLIALYDYQQWKCLFTWTELQTKDSSHRSDYLTLDRLDNSLWYIPGNVCLTTRDFNQTIKKGIPVEFIHEHMPKISNIITTTHKETINLPL